MLKTAREKLVEKDIDWKQVYTDKTLFLKEQFEAVIGPGSYFRFEGKDTGSGDEYYCIIGPAKIKHPKAKFFAGVRKLPATYPAGGKYFDSLDTAAAYASETWGVNTPKSLKPYTSAQLHGIKAKMDAWKESREEAKKDSDTGSETNTDSGSDTEKNDKEEKESNCNSGRCIMSSSNQNGKFNLRQYREAVGEGSDYAGQADSEALRGDFPRQEQAPDEVQAKTFDDIMESISVRNPDVWGILDNSMRRVERDTGVSGQVGYETKDVRTTISHLSSQDRIGLEEILAVTPDFEDRNPKFLENQMKRSKNGHYYLNGQYVTNAAIDAFHDIRERIIEDQLLSESILEQDVSGGLHDEQADIEQQLMHMDGYTNRDSKKVNEKEVLSSTVKNLIRIAKDMDDSGKYKDAEDVHQVIRRYKDKLGD